MKNKNQSPQLAWNLEALRNPSTRPTEIESVGGELYPPSGCTSTVYKFTNLDTKMWYVGMHRETDKPYFTSSTNPKFKSDLAKPDARFHFEILDWGSVQECKQIEHEILIKENAKDNPMSYNWHNGHPGVEKLRIDLVRTIVNEINTLRQHKLLDGEITPQFVTKDNVTDGIKANVLAKRPVLQTRKLEYDTENILKIQDRIQHGTGGKLGYDMPVYLTNVTIGGKFFKILKISGNHTVKSYDDHPISKFAFTPLKTIEIGPEIHEQFSEQELRMIANDLNADYNVGKPFSKDDAVKECLGHETNGYSWNTVEMQKRFRDLGLTSNQIKKVIDMVHDILAKRKQVNAGNVVINYEKGNGKLILEDEEKKYRDDNTFVMSSASGSPNTDRIIKAYLLEQQSRLDEGKKIQKKIVVLVFHTTEYTMKSWKGLKDKIEFVHNQTSILTKAIKPFIKIPKFQFEELPMYMSDTHYKRRLKSIGVKNVVNQKTLVAA